MRKRAWARVQLDAINLAVTRGVVADGVGAAVVVQVHRHPDRHRARHGRRRWRPNVRVARAGRTLRGGGRRILRRRSKVCGRLEGDVGRGRQPLDDLRRLRQLHVALLLRHAVWWRGVSVHVVSFTVWHGCRTADSSTPNCPRTIEHHSHNSPAKSCSGVVAWAAHTQPHSSATYCYQKTATSDYSSTVAGHVVRPGPTMPRHRRAELVAALARPACSQPLRTHRRGHLGQG